MTLPSLTPNQKGVLLRLGRLCEMYGPERRDRWVSAKDCGQPAGLEHLYAKGYVERRIETGPRGGEHAYYRPAAEGWAAYEKARVKQARDQMPHEIDTRLIEARKSGTPVLVYCGSPAYVRGVPGEVERDDEGRVVLNIGQRRIALRTITKVEVPA